MGSFLHRDGWGRKGDPSVRERGRTPAEPGQARLARLIEAAPTSQLVSDYKAALQRDPCSYCGRAADLLDHITARARGGGDRWENLTAACSRCNIAKRTRSVLGFLGGRLQRPAFLHADMQRVGWYMLGAGDRERGR